MEFFYISERQLICSPGIHVFRCSKVKKGIGKRNYPRCFAVSREAIYVLKPLERQDFCILKWWRPLAELEGVSLVRGKQVSEKYAQQCESIEVCSGDSCFQIQL